MNMLLYVGKKTNMARSVARAIYLVNIYLRLSSGDF